MAADTALARLLSDPRYSSVERLRTNSPMYDAVIDEIAGRNIRIGDHWLVDWASCNYLGFDLDAEIIDSISEQVRQWGTHPSWSRMLGNPRLYPQIEEELAELLGAEDVLVLPTISQIHFSVIPALVGRGTVIVESQAHKTIHDGTAQARGAGATLRRFRSGDLQRLEELLRAAAPGPLLVCIDGVNSMTGNLPDLPAHARLCREYDALLYVDDAHGMGVVGERRPDETSPYGARGNCIVRHCGETYDNVILIGGLSKSYSSLMAFLALPTDLKNLIKVAVTPYAYSGPSPVASLATVLSGLRVNAERGDSLRAELYRMSMRVLSHIRGLGVCTLNTADTPIIQLPIAEDRDLVDVCDELWRRGIYVTLAPFPGVPRDQVGFRVQITAANTDAQIDQLNDALTALAADGTLRLAPTAPRIPNQRGPAEFDRSRVVALPHGSQ